MFGWFKKKAQEQKVVVLSPPVPGVTKAVRPEPKFASMAEKRRYDTAMAERRETVYDDDAGVVDTIVPALLAASAVDDFESSAIHRESQYTPAPTPEPSCDPSPSYSSHDSGSSSYDSGSSSSYDSGGSCSSDSGGGGGGGE